MKAVKEIIIAGLLALLCGAALAETASELYHPLNTRITSAPWLYSITCPVKSALPWGEAHGGT